MTVDGLMWVCGVLFAVLAVLLILSAVYVTNKEREEDETPR